jgi:hypothetical protein
VSLSVEPSVGPALHPAGYAGNPAPLILAQPPHEHGRLELPLEQVTFRQLYSPRQVRQILHLREDFLLPRAVREAPAFIDLEKKETRRGSSARSSAWGASSARSASCR